MPGGGGDPAAQSVPIQMKDFHPGRSPKPGAHDRHLAGLAQSLALPHRDYCSSLNSARRQLRRLSRDLGLPTWDKPAYACLASRFPYGERITAERLSVIDRAEEVLRGAVPGALRVRYHGTVARIEVSPSAFPAVLARAAETVAGVKQSGFRYVTLDLQGYRTGSMNETLGGEHLSGPLPLA